MSEDSKKRLPQIKIALFGPTESGKTSFLASLLGRGMEKIAPSNDATMEEVIRTFYRIVDSKRIPLETYRLLIVDLPGRPNYENIRVFNLGKCTGLILFYDSTDLTSAQKLVKMVEEEIIEGGRGMAKKRDVDKPYLLMKAVGALEKHRKLNEKEAFRVATVALQAVGLLRPRTQKLTRWGKILQRRMKISRARRKKKER